MIITEDEDYSFNDPKPSEDINNEAAILEMFKEYSESDTPYISRTYISATLGISVNKVTTILNNLVLQNKIEYDVETNKYRLID